MHFKFSDIFKEKGISSYYKLLNIPILRTVDKIPLLAVTNVTFAKITWYLSELSDVQSRVRCITLKVR